MSDHLLDHEPAIRFVFSVVVFVLVASGEVLLPRRIQQIGRLVRWPNNLGLVVLNTVLLRLLLPTAAVGLAVIAEARGWGLLHVIALPTWLALPLAVLVLDLAIYLQHRIFHAVPVLWRLHRMHHADLEFDVTTGLRFHPVEIALSMGIKFLAIAALGPSALAVLIFEVLLNATSLFNHGNLHVPDGIDRVLRRIVVTPDMHRVHHSIHRDETDSNFGFNLPWWDHLLGTYRAQPRDGHEGMTIGIARFRTPHDLRLDRMLIQPLFGPAD